MPLIAKTCYGCHNPLSKKEHMICSQCNKGYDLPCANISPKQYNLLDQQHKARWKCLECKSKEPKTDNSNTPIRASSQLQLGPADASVDDERSNITLRTKKLHSKSDSDDPYITEDKLREILNQEITKIIKEASSQQLESITNQISEFRESVLFLSKQYDDLIKSLNEKNAIINSLESKNNNLTLQVKTLTERLTQVEQHMRSSNLEINGIPEHRSENLIKTLEQLGNVVENRFNDNDILHVTRIAKLNKDSDRPRSVIVKLRSQRRRDELLAAVIKFNKKNKNDKLNSELLGIGGRRVPVYVAEHLTPANKNLHAATRQKAKETGYKFVWIRDGRIFVRKDEQSSAIVVRDVDSLKLLS